MRVWTIGNEFLHFVELQLSFITSYRSELLHRRDTYTVSQRRSAILIKDAAILQRVAFIKYTIC